MNSYLIELDDPWIGCLAIGVVIIASISVQYLTNKLVDIEKFEAVHDVGGIYMSAVGTLYSVVLGMTLVNASEDFSFARQTVGNEVEALLKIYTASDEFPTAIRARVKTTISRYVDEVVDVEWNLLSKGMPMSDTRLLFKDIWFSLRKFEPKTENQKIIFEATVNAYTSAEEARRIRVNFSNYKITDIEWVILIAGGFVNIAFTFFFSLRNILVQSIMTGMVAFMVSINLYAIFLLGNPFSGTKEIPIDQFLFLKTYMSEGRDLHR